MRNTFYLMLYKRVVAMLTCLWICAGVSGQTPAPVPAAYDPSFKVSYLRQYEAYAPEQSASNLVTRPVLDVKQTTQFMDGLGRPLQTVTKQITPAGNDMVIPFIYDGFGRENYKYLPFAATVAGSGDVTNDGNFKLDAFQQQAAFCTGQYPGETFYYGQVNYEASPLNRPVSVAAAGNSWVGNSRLTSVQQSINTTADSVYIWNVDTTLGSKPVSGGLYAAGQLYKTVTTDAQNNAVVEFKDKAGHIILKKVQSAPSPGTGYTGWLATYYAYDDLDNLRWVLSPRAVELLRANSWSFAFAQGQLLADELCYRYEFDPRHRMIIKKMAGAGEIWMVYDARGRLVMTQDANLRSRTPVKWMVTEFDSLDRPYRSGLWTDANNRVYHQGQAYNSISYPNTGANYEILSQTYFDDYSWVAGTSSGLSSSMATNYTSNSAYFITTYGSSPSYAVAVSAYPSSRSLITGMREKVLGTASQYLYTATFYDDHGQPVQRQSNNYSGGVDTATTQYDFAGRILRTLLNHRKNGNTVQNHWVLTKNTYDAGGRIKNIFKNIDNTGDQLIDSMQYDQLGQLKAKYLGNRLDSLFYDYNIRGWTTAINKSYLQGTKPSYFGEELGFDKITAALPGTTYAPQFTGNVAGMIWKGGGDGMPRKYDFSYDNANRLTKAGFTQNSSGAGWDSATVNYSVSNLTYDANGNIMSMNQAGLKVTSSALIDQLTYTYDPYSNKLGRVDDGQNDTQTQLGDFHWTTTTKPTGDDYGYDANGNVTHDNNKLIDMVVYNHLNLPQSVHVKGKGTITYTYDAMGQKLAKLSMDSLSKHAATTLYLDGFVYQQHDTITSPSAGIDTLQFLPHEEGRIRWAFHRWTNGNTQYKWEYDFFEKDHLGNVREVLTQQRDTAQYTATMEAAYRSTENALFYNIPNTCVWSYYVNASAGPNPFGTAITNPNDSVSRISGSTPKEGPSIILKVMAGDLYRVGIYSYWKSGQTSAGTTDATTEILSALANGIVSLSGSSKGTYSTLSNTSTSPLLGGVNAFRTAKNPTPPSNPKAYLNFLALDDRFNYDSLASGAIAAGGPDVLNPLATDTIRIRKNGYLYIYLTNETKNVSVFFDNLSITHYPGPLLEETHYYPYGLTMAGISDRALKARYPVNNYRFGDKELQNQEFGDGTGLDDYDFGARWYDPQVGRWLQPDPMAEYMRRWSPYNYAFDNPVRFSDPTGEEPHNEVDSNGEVVRVYDAEKEAVVTAKSKKAKKSGFWAGVGHFLWASVDYLPLAGGLKEFGMGIYDGNWKEAGMGLLMVGVDVFTAGEGGNLIRLGEKGVQVLGEDEVKEFAEKEILENVEEQSFKSGGRLGKEETRKQIGEIANELENRGYEITGGGGKLKEEYLKPLNGSKKGGSFPDITATKNGRTIRINTADVRKSGKYTTRELKNAARIRKQAPNDHLILIPKRV